MADHAERLKQTTPIRRFKHRIFQRRYIATSVVVVMLIVVVGAFLTGRPAALSSVAPATPRIVVVATQPIVSRLSVVGTIEPGNILNIVSPLSGTVQEKHFDYGNSVDRDAPLLTMNVTELEGKVQESQAAMLKAARVFRDMQSWGNGPDTARAKRGVISAQLALDESKRKLAETGILLERGIVAKMEYDGLLQQVKSQELQLAAAHDDLEGTLNKAAPENLKIAKLEWDSARKKFDEVSEEMSHRTISAPASGVVLPIQEHGEGQLSAPIGMGSRVTKGQALFRIANVETLIVAAKVNEVDVNQLQKGQEVEVTGDAFQAFPMRGYITRIAVQATPSLGGGSRAASFEIAAEIPKLTDEQRKHIRVGMSARLSIIHYQKSNAIVLPTAAVHVASGKSFLWVKDAQGEQRKRIEVVTGIATESGIEIVQGIKEGDQVVVD
jgi:HlyD family secretion protein